MGRLKRICKDAFCVASTVQETSRSDMSRGQGADLLREVAFLEHQIFRFAKMCDRCSTSYDLVALFRGRRNINIYIYISIVNHFVAVPMSSLPCKALDR